jgi:hypothetical protein
MSAIEVPIESQADTAVKLSACPVCQLIADAATDWPLDAEGSPEFSLFLDTWAGLKQRQDCKTCQQIVQYFSKSRENGDLPLDKCRFYLDRNGDSRLAIVLVGLCAPRITPCS